MCAGSPSSGARVGAPDAQQWSSGSIPSSLSRSSAFRWPSKMRPTRRRRPWRPRRTSAHSSRARRRRRQRAGVLSASNACAREARAARPAPRRSRRSPRARHGRQRRSRRLHYPRMEVRIPHRDRRRPIWRERRRARVPARAPSPTSGADQLRGLPRRRRVAHPTPTPSWASTIPPGSQLELSSIASAPSPAPVVRVRVPADDLQPALARELGREVRQMPPRNAPPLGLDAVAARAPRAPVEVRLHRPPAA